ncbi:MAG: DUF5685 family protein [Spirochaetes bacterium]|nr:DUF5685 family protein [Spirochaetota bacterium]
MLGYIEPDKKELKVKHFNFYNSIYCSLCFNIKSYSNFCRLFLSKDSIFFYLLFISNLEKIDYSFIKRKCPLNPFKKVDIYVEKKFLPLFSEISILIIILKLFDLIYDNKNIILKKLIKSYIKKLLKRLRYIYVYFQDPFEHINNYYRKEKEIYKTLNNSFNNFENFNEGLQNYFLILEKYHDNFYELFKKFLPLEYIDIKISENYQIITKNVLKIITIIDSLDDIKKDVRKSQENILFPIIIKLFQNSNKNIYNKTNKKLKIKNINFNYPFLILKNNLKDKNFSETFNKVKEIFSPLLKLYLDNIRESYIKIKSISPYKNLYNEELLDNYFYYGFEKIIKRVLY